MRMPKRPAKSFEATFRSANPDALDLLKKMLTFNPEERIKVEDALAHPYLAALHFPDDEPTCDPVSLFDFEFERQVLTMTDLKNLIYEEILLYHFQGKKEQYEKARKDYDRQLHLPGRRMSRDREESDEEDELN
mmetsp:Transcript_10817/g.10855  ORF Transcript_10817/g.10855 Transcript_10817/m.10855 type:complete len:134 (-) Transcript_10817:36-437(-)